MKKNWQHIVCIILVLIYLVLVSYKNYCTPVPKDEEVYITGGYLVLEGLIPYKDFFDVKPIVIYVMNALGLLLFGTRGCAFRLMPYVFIFPAIILF